MNISQNRKFYIQVRSFSDCEVPLSKHTKTTHTTEFSILIDSTKSTDQKFRQ